MNFDDYGLDDGVKAKIQAAYDADISGLKTKNSDLIERARTIKEELEQSQINYAKADEETKIALAEKEGDIGKYKVAVEESNERIQSLELEFKEKEKARLIDSTVNDFVNTRVKNDPAARKYMEGIYRESIDVVDGAVKPKDITKSLEDLSGSIISDDSFSNYIKVDVGSGANSVGSTGTSQARATGTPKEQRIAAINQRLGAS